ncbi:MAG TPA: hypothetical protein VLB75_09215 [Steroidobacteraceae bacterium]|nr:hypothetical protein [Steroidobacteraceae bacterium]
MAILAAAFSASAANTFITNPFGLAYQNTTGASQYAHPGGMLVTSACNRYDSGFATARANGAEILAYLNPVERPDWSICTLADGFYYGDPSNVPLWPYPSYGKRINYPNNHLTDLRRGSAWSNYVVAYIEKLMREDKVDGVFLDVVGGRLWSSSANWDSWPQSEKDAWTDGNVDLVRRLDAKRRAINPRFIIVNNGNWTRIAGDTRASAGEPFVDGVAMEHHASTSAFHRAYAARTFSNLGHRRVIVIGRDTADALAWKDVQGVTHVSNQATYAQVTAPVISFRRLTDRPKRFGRASKGTIWTPGFGMNYKRGSRFNLAQKGTLLNLAACLDGKGGSSGGQSLRMVLYRDSGGVPGALVAQSSAVAVSAGSSSRWVYFPAPAARLDPGNYWITIHSGSTSAIARITGDGDANWRGATDTYSDGATNPFGSGSSGTMTLSLFASYTVGY